MIAHLKKGSTLLANKTVKNFAVYSAGSIVLRGITALTSLVTLNMLTPTEFGLLSLINNFCVIFPLFMNLGLRQAFGLEYFHHDSTNRKKIFHTAIYTYLMIAIPIFCFMLYHHNWLNTYFFLGKATTAILLLCLCYSFIQFFSELYLQVLRYQCNATKLTVTQLTAALITMAATGLFVFYLPFRITGVILSNFLAIASICTIALIQYNKKLGFASIPKFPTHKQSRNLLWLGLPFIPNILLMWVLSSGDRWILAYLTNLHNVGIYSLADMASQIFQLVILVPLSGSYIPFMLKKYAEKREPLETIERQNINTMWIAMGLATATVTIASIGAMLVGPYFLPTKFHAALNYIWFLLLGDILFMGTYFSSCYIVFCKKIWTQLWFTAICAASNIALNFMLVPFFSITGCILATLCANAIFFFLNLWWINHYGFLPQP